MPVPKNYVIMLTIAFNRLFYAKLTAYTNIKHAIPNNNNPVSKENN